MNIEELKGKPDVSVDHWEDEVGDASAYQVEQALIKLQDKINELVRAIRDIKKQLGAEK